MGQPTSWRGFSFLFLLFPPSCFSLSALSSLLFPPSSSSSPLSLPLSPLLVAPLERGGHGVTSMLAACPAMLVNRRPCLSLGVALFVFTFPLDTNETGRSREWGSVSFVGKVKKKKQSRPTGGHVRGMVVLPPGRSPRALVRGERECALHIPGLGRRKPRREARPKTLQ